MSALYEDFVRDTSQPDRIILTGSKIVITDESYSPDLNLVVRASSVEIRRPIKLPSKFVHIFSQSISFHDGASIDVSGGVGTPDFSLNTRAKDGQSPGEAGSDGSAGGPGQDAGEIKLVAESLMGTAKLIANGGNGGRGQDGGFGARGQAGEPGPKGVPEHLREAANGGTGFRGGRAGRAGIPGKGGNGGNIVVAILAGVKPHQVQAEMSPGQPGAMASTGQPGPGGSGGPPGTWMKRVEVPRE